MQIYQFKVLSDGYLRPIEPTEKKQYLCHNIPKRKCVHKKCPRFILSMQSELLMLANVV